MSDEKGSCAALLEKLMLRKQKQLFSSNHHDAETQALTCEHHAP
jgi:hypothetical protein